MKFSCQCGAGKKPVRKADIGSFPVCLQHPVNPFTGVLCIQALQLIGTTFQEVSDALGYPSIRWLNFNHPRVQIHCLKFGVVWELHVEMSPLVLNKESTPPACDSALWHLVILYSSMQNRSRGLDISEAHGNVYGFWLVYQN